MLLFIKTISYLTFVTDPFFTTKEPNKGTGLGLSITYSIIEALKGQMDLHSEVDKGTTVEITLPILIPNKP